MFDLQTIKHEKNVTEAKSFMDRIWAIYYQRIWSRDFGYMTKGIHIGKDGEGPELMFAGPVNYQGGKFVMTKPELVIGSDRLELYEHFARRREVMVAYNRNFLKLAFGVTAAHFVAVQVPTMFSQYFGDDISATEK